MTVDDFVGFVHLMEQMKMCGTFWLVFFLQNLPNTVDVVYEIFTHKHNTF